MANNNINLSSTSLQLDRGAPKQASGIHQSTTTTPKQFMDLIAILDTYQIEDSGEKLVFIKNGIKIIL